MIFYEYEKRHAELGRITKISDGTEKSQALTKFIEDELDILRGMNSPKLRSQALSSAKSALKNIEEAPASEHAPKKIDF